MHRARAWVPTLGHDRSASSLTGSYTDTLRFCSRGRLGAGLLAAELRGRCWSAPASARAGTPLPELRRGYPFISDVVVVFKVHAKCVVFFFFSPMLCNIHFLTGNFFVQHFNKHFAFKLCLGVFFETKLLKPNC